MRMKGKILFPIIFCLVLLLSFTTGITSVYAYTTGTVNDWSGILDDPTKYTVVPPGHEKLFDNYGSTMDTVGGSIDIVLNNPTDIYSSKVSADGSGTISYYDANNSLLWSQGLGYSYVNELKDLNLAGVKKININGTRVYEFDIKGMETADDPVPPTGLAATAGSRDVTLRWNTVAGATGYNVKRSLINGGPYTVIASNISTTYYLDTDLSNSVKDLYYYVVTAVSPTGVSENSNQVSYRHPIVSATVNDWSGMLDDSAKYTVLSPGHEKLFDNYGNTMDTVGGSIDIVLNNPMDIYSSKVSADGSGTISYYDANNNLLWSQGLGYSYVNELKDLNLAGVKKININGTRVYEFDIKGMETADDPVPPTGLAATAGSRDVTLRWNTVAGATGYNVKRSLINGGPYTVIASNISTPYYLDTDLSNSVKDLYYYVVTAVSPTGVSENSSQVSYRHPIVSATVNDWSGMLDDSAKYIVLSPGHEKLFDNYGNTMDTVGGSIDIVLNNPMDIYSSKVSADGSGTISYYDANNNLLWSQGLGYSYVNELKDLNLAGVKKININGTRVYEFDIKGMETADDPVPPTGLTTTAGSRDVTLKWNTVAGATGYNVKRSLINGGPYTVIASNISTPYYLDTDLSNSVKDTYYYVVTAISPTGVSENSSQVSYRHPYVTGSVNDWSGILDDSAKYTVLSPGHEKLFDNYGNTMDTVGGSIDIVLNNPTDIYSSKVSTDGSGTISYYDASNNLVWSQGLGYSNVVEIKDINLAGIKKININGSRVYEFDIKGMETADDPVPPTGLTTTAGSRDVTLRWNTVTGATGYNVKRSLINGGPYTVIAGNIDTTYYLDTDLSNSVKDTYYYVVTAISPTGVSENSSQVSYRHPYITANVSNWSGMLDDSTKYTIVPPGHQYLLDNNGATMDTVGGSIDIVLNNPTDIYSSKVSTDGSGTISYYDASNNLVWSQGLGYSNVVEIKDINLAGVKKININGSRVYEFDVTELVTQDNLKPPTTVTASAGLSKISINWSAISNATSYNVKRAEVSGGPYTVIANNVTGLSYTDASVVNGKTYYYVVSSVNSGVESADSVEKSAYSVGTLAAPVASVKETTTSSITIGWNAVPAATAYDIEVDNVVISDITGTAYTHADLLPGTKHTYRVRAKNGTVLSAWSNLLTVSTKIDGAITEIPEPIPSAIAKDSVTISWSAITGATAYDIEVDGSVVSGITDASYTNTGLLPDTQHRYRVRTNVDGVTGEWSYLLVVKTASTTQPTTTTIGTPENLAISFEENTILLSWDPVTDAAGYDIEVDGEVIDNSIDLVYTHSDLAVGTQHTYRVRAKTTAEVGTWTTLIKVTMPQITTVTSAPEVPANVESTSNSTTIIVVWDKAAGANKYEIEVDGVVVDNGSNTTYIHRNLTPATEHTYRVRAVNELGASDWSNVVVETTTLAFPVNIDATATDTTIVLSWSDSVGATSYDVELDGVITTNVSSPYEFTNLNPGTQYTYRVRATNGNITSAWSAATNVSTLGTSTIALVAPTNINTTATDKKITLTWDAVQGAASYDIEVDGVVIDNGNVTTYVLAGLAPDAEHTFRIRAKNSTEEGPWTDILTVRTALSAPTGVSATGTATEIVVIWDPVANATRYEIMVDGQIIDVGTETTYVHTGLLPATWHTYSVRAIVGDTVGQWSTEVSKRTKVK